MAKQHNPAFLRLVADAKTRIEEIDVAGALARQAAGAHLIDVREESEFARDRCAGALHLGKGVLERDVEKRFPEPETELILYCGGGYRSALAADALQRMGYTRVTSLAGGIRAWREAAAPLES